MAGDRGRHHTGEISPQLEKKLEVAQQKLERVLDNQLQSINGLSNNIAVVLGLIVTGLGFLVASGHQLFVSSPGPAYIGFALILGSAAILVGSFYATASDAPNPPALVGNLVDPRVTVADLHQEAITGMTVAYLRNLRLTRSASLLLNGAVLLLLVGLSALVIAAAQ